MARNSVSQQHVRALEIKPIEPMYGWSVLGQLGLQYYRLAKAIAIENE